MAIYRYDLAFSSQNVMSGNFATAIWYQWAASNPGNPANFSPYPNAVTGSILAGTWTQLAGIPANFNSANTANPDYVYLRIFDVYGLPASYLARTTVIFGHGASATSPTSSVVQSPFVKDSSNQPMPVIDCDTSAFSIVPPQRPPWPAPFTDVGPVGPTSSWSYCLGEVMGPSNDYVFNVGVSLYVLASGATWCFGIDPHMRVTGTSMTAAKDKDAA